MWRLVEALVAIAVILLTFKELIVPLFQDKPLFPMLRKTYAETKNPTTDKDS